MAWGLGCGRSTRNRACDFGWSTRRSSAAARTSENLRIYIDSDCAVPAIRDILAEEKAGLGRIKIQAQPRDCRWEAELELDESFTLSPDAQLALRNLPDVIRIETFEMR